MSQTDRDPYARYGIPSDAEAALRVNAQASRNTHIFWFELEKLREPLDTHPAVLAYPHFMLMRVTPSPYYNRSHPGLAPKFELATPLPSQHDRTKLRSTFWRDIVRLSALRRRSVPDGALPPISISWDSSPRFNGAPGTIEPNRFDVFRGRLRPEPGPYGSDSNAQVNLRSLNTFSLCQNQTLLELQQFVRDYGRFLDEIHRSVPDLNE